MPRRALRWRAGDAYGAGCIIYWYCAYMQRRSLCPAGRRGRGAAGPVGGGRIAAPQMPREAPFYKVKTTFVSPPDKCAEILKKFGGGCA